MKTLLLAIFLAVLSFGAQAATCPTPLTVKDSTNTTQNISTTDDASGNCQTNVVNTPAALTPVATAQMGLTVATATTLTVPATATTAFVTVEGQNVRYRDDGTAPTASVGTLVPVGAQIILKLTSFTNAQFIQTAATATLDVSYYK